MQFGSNSCHFAILDCAHCTHGQITFLSSACISHAFFFFKFIYLLNFINTRLFALDLCAGSYLSCRLIAISLCQAELPGWLRSTVADLGTGAGAGAGAGAVQRLDNFLKCKIWVPRDIFINKLLKMFLFFIFLKLFLFIFLCIAKHIFLYNSKHILI